MPELDLPPEGTLEWAEELYMLGCTDEASGDVECPDTGHFYRVERWVVMTDNQGFHYLQEHMSEAEAKFHFEELDQLYSEWEDADES